MKDVILFLAEVVDFFHDAFYALSESLGLQLTDKELHFWIIGIMGIVSFIIVDLVFHQLAKLSISVLSFIYTFTFVLVFVFALEIQQGVTNSGNMEFDDAAAGIIGFFGFFAAYGIIRILLYSLKKIVQHIRK
ncbi:hypothetical protein [Pontibacillus litoralis]|uniref:Membrane protein n=1 Tax=Pontibacillus litoralis JSM 072002 TaxID=1385512 RepID=A0A0A5G5N0_9BACI|nr:hypothetical protein [Pontibacillus litoralis]KGX87364.1 membrane protein [Pontibacillus litoralis JSM 072002]